MCTVCDYVCLCNFCRLDIIQQFITFGSGDILKSVGSRVGNIVCKMIVSFVVFENTKKKVYLQISCAFPVGVGDKVLTELLVKFVLDGGLSSHELVFRLGQSLF